MQVAICFSAGVADLLPTVGQGLAHSVCSDCAGMLAGCRFAYRCYQWLGATLLRQPARHSVHLRALQKHH